MINARAFLSKEGFLFGKSRRQLERLYSKQFPAAQADEINYAFMSIKQGSGNPSALNKTIKTIKHWNVLWSIDVGRHVVGFDWIADQINLSNPKSIVDMGCGVGTLLKFIQLNFPEIRLAGIEEEPNFTAIARDIIPDVAVIEANYLEVKPEKRFDTVICNFGFDLSKFAASTTPHSTHTIGNTSFCPGCSDDFAGQFSEYIRNWRSWAAPSAELILVGRLPGFGHIRGTIIAAAESGWKLDKSRSRYLTVEGIGFTENFPAMVFKSFKVDNVDSIVLDAEQNFGADRLKKKL